MGVFYGKEIEIWAGFGPVGITEKITLEPIKSNFLSRFFQVFVVKNKTIVYSTDNGHPERPFFQKFETFGLGQTNWAEILGCILVISSQTIGTILEL